jgi:hypothetical protein
MYATPLASAEERATTQKRLGESRKKNGQKKEQSA